MVWFQCEDCGENLKKPKLATHFRICSAYKVSCIDCGETFDQQSVQGHTQCITEAEKYGPKTNGKPTQTPNSKSDKPKPNSDVDINVGLSSRPPWFCSLCNTTTTSKQTLLSHAEGKKHRAKARAFNAQNQPKNDITETPVTDEPAPPKDTAESEEKNNCEEKNIKRKREEEGQNGQVVQNEGPICESKKKKGDVEKIKWKKIITKTLKSNDGVLKIKKLIKQVIKGLKESGVDEDKDQLSEKIINQINSSSRFLVQNKHVKLVSKE